MLKHTKTNLLLLVARKVAISFRFVLVLAVLASGILYTRAGTPERAYAATASTLNFQARLLQSNGAIVADGNYSVEFKLYNASTGGSAIWTETRTGTVTVKSGYLSVYLGDVTALPTSGWDQEKFLTMNVNGDGEMSPRLRLTAVPYAFQAQRAEGLEKLVGAFTGTLNFNGTLGQNTTYTLPDPGQASVNICLSSGNCAGQGGSISGSGTQGRIAYFDTVNGNNLGDGWLFQNTGTSTLELDSSRNLSLLGGNLSVTGNGSFTGNMTIGDASGDTLTINGTAVSVPNGLNVDSNTFVIDATNNRVGIGDATPAAALTVGNGDLFQVNSSGAIAAATGITSSGTITFSALNTVGLVQTNGSGQLSTGVIDRNSATLFSGDLNVSNGGTGVGTFTSNGIVYGNGTGALQTTGAAANSVLVTDGSNVPSLSQTLPNAVQGNITSTGALNAGSITSGFGAIDTGADNITTSGILQGGTLNVTGNGTIGGTLAVQGASVTVGGALQAGSVIINDGAGATATISTAALTQSTVFALPDVNSATAEFCVKYGAGLSNCFASGNQVDSVNTLQGDLNIVGTTNEIEVTDNGTDTITIGLPNDVTIGSDLTVTDTVLISGAGTALTVTNGASVGTLAVTGTSTFTGLATFNGGVTVANNSNFSQTGSGTFSTGTGAVSLNGATSVTGSNTFTVGTGLTTLGGGLTATGTTNINATGTAATVIGNTSATLTLNGSSVVLGSASVTRTASGTTTFDLIDSANTTLAVTNSGAGNANLTVDGSGTFATGLTVSAGGASITGNSTITGTLSGLTGLTSSGTITFSGLSTDGVVTVTGGVLGSTSTLSVANGGTGAATLTANGILFGNGTSAVQATAAAANSVLVTDGSNVPSLSQTLPNAVQTNITATGALDAGSITANFGAIDVGADAISTTGTITAGTLSVTGNATVTGTLGVTGLATFNGGLTVANGQQLTNSGSTLFTAVGLGNLTSGPIGTAAATVDAATTFNIPQTTASQTFTIPTPTDTTAGRIVYINNIGNTSFTMYGITITAGRAQGFIWTGTAWTGAGIDSAGNGITGIGTIDGQTPKVADGAQIFNNNLYLQTADASFPGLVSTGAQTFAGVKTFGSQIVANAGISLGSQTLQGTTAIIDFTNFDVDASGNTDVAGTFTSGTGNAFTINATGAITAATGITSSGTITFSGLGTGLVSANGSGVLSSGAVDRNSASYFSNALSVANGGTGATTLTSNGILFGNGTSAIQATTAAANSVLVTNGSNVPSLSQTLPTAVQGNITGTGILTSGSIASGFGTISTANNITTTATLSGGTLTVTNDATIGGDVVISGGQLTVGTAAGQAGSIILYDGGSGGSQNTLTIDVDSGLGQNTVITFPDPGAGTAEVCYRNDNNCGFALTSGSGNYVQFTPNSAQTDNNAFASIFINDTGGGHLLHLQSGGVDQFVVENDGDVTAAGDLAVNGGDITSTSGLNVTASNGALTFTSVGVGNDIILNSADTIELQDNTNITGNLDVSGSLTAGTGNAFNVNSSGAITAATGIVSSGTIQFSGLTAGVVTANGSGVIASGTLDRNSSTYFTGTLSVANGGTGATTFNTNGVVYYNGTTQVSTTAGANSVLITNGSNVPSLSQTLPNAVQDNITRTGALNSGSITSGFGSIDTGADNIQTTGTVQGGIINATTGFRVNGTAAAGNYLRGDGTNFISSALLASDLSGTIFSSAADTGTGTFVTGDTISVQGGTNGIDTSLTGDTFTINLDTTEIGTTTFGAGSGFTWTFDAGVTDPSIAFASDALTVTAGNTTFSGDLAVNGGDLTSSTSLNVTASNGALTMTSTGAGNDVVINSADTIELQDNTNVTGSLSVSNGLTVTAGGASIAGNTTIATTAGNTLSLGNASGALTVTGSSASTFVINGITVSASEFNLLDGKDAALVDVNDAVNTAITGTGALNSGSITSGFGSIDTGADNIQTTGTVQGGIVNATTGFRVNGTAATGNYLRGDGTNFISSALMASDLSGTIFSSAADSGTGTFVTGDTISVQGGTNGIDTSLTGDTFTINLDTTEIGTTTFGSGSGFTWTFNAGATDPTIAFASDALTVTAATTTLSGDLAVNGGDITSTTSLDVTASNGALTLTSTGVGNDIVLNSADTIELQDNTNITGSLSVSNGLTVTAGGASIAGNTTIATTAGNTLSLGNATGALTVTGSSASTFVINGITVTASEFNLLDGKDAALVDVNDAVNTAITGTGALNAGSITSGFGSIDTGADNIQTTGTVQGGIVNATTGFRINGGATTGNYLRGNGTNFVSSALLASDLSGTVFSSAADSGTGTYESGDTISIQGGTNGIDTSLTGDTFTLNLDYTEIGDAVFGNNSDASIIWGFDPTGATNPSFTFADNAITLTAATVTLSGDLRVNGNDIQDSAGTTRITLGATNTITGNLSVTANLTVDGNTTLGNAAGDTLTITGTAVSIPNSLNFDSNTLYIDAGNNRVGIGTASPGEMFHVLNSANAIAAIETTSGSGAYALQAFKTPTRQYRIGVATSSETLFGLADKFFLFDSTANAPRFVVDTNGNMGLGDVGPDAKLEVLATTEQLRLTHTDGTADSRFTVDASGNLTIDNTGTKMVVADDLQVSGNDILDSAATARITLGATNTITGNIDVTGGITAGTNDAFSVSTTGVTNIAITDAGALRVQNTSGADTLFTVDTSARGVGGGNRIKIGNDTGTDTNVTILQVDSTTADITSNLSALNGGLYYNSTDNTIKAIINGAVDELCFSTLGNCAGSGTSVTQSGTNASGQVAFFTSGNNITSNTNFLFDGTNVDVGGSLTVGTADAVVIAANGNITTAGDIAVNGGDITSTGALNITPGGALTVGTVGQTATLQGTITTITSNGAGNDIILSSADTIELQGTTNITGSLTVSVNADIAGTLFVGTGDAFQVDANGNILTSGDAAINGGDITSTGALNITPGGALTVGATGQTSLLQGSTVSITSNGAGNDVTVTSADQIILNSVGTIELQDNTNVTGNFTVSGNGDVAGYLYVGSADQFQVDASGNTQTSGTLQVGGMATLNGGFTATRTLGVDSGTTQNVGNISFTTPADTTGTNTANGLNINPTVGNATGGTNTANIINIANTTGDAQVSLNAINIGTLTGTAANEYALNIGSGWDSILRVGGTEVINGSGQIVSSTITGTLFNTSADTGTGSIVYNDTFAIQGGTNGIDTSLTGDTYTLDLDYTEITTATFGTGSGFTWTYDVGAVDPTIAFASDLVTLTVGSTVLSGDLAVNGGDITSTGALNITPGGALTVGVASQNATLQGAVTTITSNGAGNDVTVTSADQIILNSVGTIELQDNTNITGNLDVSGSITGGSADQFNVDASGNIVTSGDLAVNGGDITSTGALNITPGGALTVGVTAQSALFQGSTVSITSTGAGNDITLTSADQIILNSGSTIELQDSANVTGNLDSTGSLTVGSADQFQVSSGGALTFSGVATDITTGTDEDFTVVANGNGIINLNDLVRVGTLAAADTDSYAICRDASSGQLGACDANTTGRPFLQGGNSFGAAAVLGTNDSQALQLETVNVVRLEVQTDGDVAVDTDTLFVDAVNNRVGVGDTTPAYQFTVGASDSFGIDTSGNVIIKGAGAAATADLSFGAGANRTINVLTQTAANTAGNNLTLQSGTGNGTGAGGNLQLTAGTGGGSAGAGGDVVIQGGAAGAGSTTAGSVIFRSNANNKTTALLIQNSSSTNLLVADTTNMVIKIASGAEALSSTLANVRLITDNAAVTNTLRVGSATDNINFGETVAGKLRFVGNARNAIGITISPEFPGATMTADSTSNVGVMTSDFCSDLLGINDSATAPNTAVCPNTGGNEAHNYYSWTGNASNGYSIWTKWRVPSNFSAFDSTAAQFYGWKTASGDTLTVTFYKNGTSCGSASLGTAAAWTLTNISSMSGCTISANDELIIRAQVAVGTNGNFSRMGEIYINYLAAF